jgi:hypothetical protein
MFYRSFVSFCMGLGLFVFSLPAGLKAWAGSIEVRIEDPCHVGRVLKQTAVTRSEAIATAGDATVAALESLQLDYQGAAAGIESILKTPTSLDAVEFETDSSFRIHGWCYQVDGFEPGVMMGEFKLEPRHRVIRWFFGYARYRNGDWEGYCNTDQVHTEYCKGRQGISIER